MNIEKQQEIIELGVRFKIVVSGAGIRDGL